jgi:uncharacterized membrane protein
MAEPVKITESVIVKGPVDEIFGMWSDLEMLPSIIKDLKEVSQLDELTSHWVVQGPFGKDYQWIAEITRFDEDRRIAWRTLEGDIKTSGQVTFKDLPEEETEMTVMMQYVPPAGKVGAAVSKVIDNPRNKIAEGLRDFKAFAEGMPDRIHKDNKENKAE